MHVANLPGRARRGVTYNIMSVGRCRTMWVSNGYALQHVSVEVQADREAVGRWAGKSGRSRWYGCATTTG